MTDQLSVRCLANGAIEVHGARVVAGAGGVALRVSSHAPAGAKLSYDSPGDRTLGLDSFLDAPQAATTWLVPARPGAMTLTCHRSGTASSVDVLVADPRHVWGSATLTDLGCLPGELPPALFAFVGAGGTPQAAADNVLHNLRSSPAGTRPPGRIATFQAPIGYPAASHQTWLITVDGRPYLSLSVSPVPGDYAPGAKLAIPDTLCTH